MSRTRSTTLPSSKTWLDCAPPRRRRSTRSVREADAPVEPARGVDVEHPHRDVAVVAKAVLDTGRRDPECPGRRRHLPLAELERHLALEDVERVVLAVVHVRLEHAPGRDLDDLEVEPRRVDGPCEELDVAEPVTLPGRDDDRFAPAPGFTTPVS